MSQAQGTASDAEFARRLQQQEFAAHSGAPGAMPVGTPVYDAKGSVPMASTLPPAQQFAQPQQQQVPYPVQAVFYTNEHQQAQQAQAQPQPQYTLPQGPFGLGQAETLTQREVVLLHLLQLSRTVRCFCMIDFILTLLNVGDWRVLLSVLPAAGYYGAVSYQRGWVMAYIIFLFVKTLAYVVMLLKSADEHETAAESEDTEGRQRSNPFWYLLSVMLNMWITHYVLRFYTLLKQVPEADVEAVRSLERGGDFPDHGQARGSLERGGGVPNHGPARV